MRSYGRSRENRLTEITEKIGKDLSLEKSVPYMGTKHQRRKMKFLVSFNSNDLVAVDKECLEWDLNPSEPVFNNEQNPDKSITETPPSPTKSTHSGKLPLSQNEQFQTLSEQELNKDLHQNYAHIMHKNSKEFSGIWESLSPELQELVRNLPNLPDEVKESLITLVKGYVSRGKNS